MFERNPILIQSRLNCSIAYFPWNTQFVFSSFVQLWFAQRIYAMRSTLCAVVFYCHCLRHSIHQAQTADNLLYEPIRLAFTTFFLWATRRVAHFNAFDLPAHDSDERMIFLQSQFVFIRFKNKMKISSQNSIRKSFWFIFVYCDPLNLLE